MSLPEALPSVRLFPLNEPRFGTAVSQFQVEGNVSGERHSDWDAFMEHYPDICHPDEKGPDWWSGKWKEDFDSMAQLGMTVQRMGIEWARVMPEKGKVDETAVAKYRTMITYLHELNIDPMITAFHFVLPDWVAQEGGWESSRIKQSFAYFTELLADRFGDVPYWVTVNEPMNTVAAGYFVGEWPPGKKHDLKGTIFSRRHLIQAHDICYTAIKKAIPDAFVGAANAVIWVEPHSQSLADRVLVGLDSYIYNTNFIYATQDMVDFIGMNYYTGYFLKFNPKSPGLATGENEKGAHGVVQVPFGDVITPDGLTSDLGWPIVPEFFLKALQSLHEQFNKPIVVTENGIADRSDQYRSYYLLTHLIALHEAQRRGIDIPMYIHWSTNDNQEWMDGFQSRFGLVEVNPTTGERTIRKSALLYADIAEAREIDIPRLAEEYLSPDQQEMLGQFLEGLDKRDDSWLNRY